MSMLTIGPDALDYLGGSALEFGSLPPPAVCSPVTPAARRLERIPGVGNAVSSGSAPGPAPVSEPLLAGLAGESIPLAFHVAGGTGGVSFSLGTSRKTRRRHRRPHRPALDGLTRRGHTQWPSLLTF